MNRRRTIAIALGCLIVVGLALGPATRLSVQSWLRQSYGPEAHIGSVSIHPLRGEINLHDLKIDADSQDGTPFKIANVMLKVSAGHALSRKLVVDRAILEGIQMPALKPNPSLVPTLGLISPTSDSSELIPKEFTSGQASDVWESFQGQMQLKSKAATVSQNWQQRFLEFDNVEQDIRRGVEGLKSNEKLLENPLRNIPALRASIQQANELRSQIDKTRAELEGVPRRLQEDRLKLDDIGLEDLQDLVQRVPLKVTDSEQATDSFLEVRAVSLLRELERYATLAMSTIHEPLRILSDDPTGDKDYHFPELESSPGFWMQRTSIHGDANIGGDWHSIEGLLVDLTNSPELIPRPMTGNWKALANQRDVEIKTRRSFSIHRPTDEISVHAHQFGSGYWELACNRDVRLTCQGGPPQAIAEWQIDANQWECKVLVTQANTDFKMARSTPNEFDRIGLEIDRALANVTHFELEIRIAAIGQGEPKLTWESNLAEPMRQGLAIGLKNEIESQLETLRNRYFQAFDENWSDLKAIVKARSSSVSRRLDQLNKDLERFSTDVRTRIDLRDTRLANQPHSEDKLDR